MSTQISLDKLASAIERSMVGYKLDGISLPKDTRVMTDVFGEMLYHKLNAVELEALPEKTRDTIRKYIHE